MHKLKIILISAAAFVAIPAVSQAGDRTSVEVRGGYSDGRYHSGAYVEFSYKETQHVGKRHHGGKRHYEGHCQKSRCEKKSRCDKRGPGGKKYRVVKVWVPGHFERYRRPCGGFERVWVPGYYEKKLIPIRNHYHYGRGKNFCRY